MPDRPLLLTGDPALLDDLLRLASAAGVEPQVASDVGAVHDAWTIAPLVLVGSDAVSAVTSAGLPRRPGVLLVSTGADPVAVWERAAGVGAESVLPLPGAAQLLVERLAAAGSPALAPTVAVLGGCGGAGASTLACALARAAAAGGPVMLVDADPLGGGLDLVLGAEGEPGLRWPDLAATRGRADPAELGSALPTAGGVTLLSWHRGEPVPLPADAMESVLDAGRRSHGLVVVDLPRSPDDGAVVALGVAALTLLVVPARLRSLAAAEQVVRRLVPAPRDLRVVVRGPAPAGLTAARVAGRLGLPLAGWLPPEPGLAAAQERGEPPARSGRSPLARLGRDLVAGLAVGFDGRAA